MKIVIADDSPLLRQVLKDLLQKTNKIQVIGEAKNGQEAIDLVKQLKPDVLILDCEMPIMNGLEALRRIMTETPLPVFMFSSLTSKDASVTLKALEYGAIDYLLKPMGGPAHLEEVINELVTKLNFVFLKGKLSKLKNETIKIIKPTTQNNLLSIKMKPIEIIALGSSTGGVQAALEVIPKLPQGIKPIVWVQHMPGTFTKNFAERLNTSSKIKVKEASDGELIEPSTCYLAPGGFQMRILKSGNTTRIKIGETDKVGGHSPACNVLFESVAKYYPNNALGVILTGMGDDGTKGLFEMHSKGSFVIGQDENSSVVYGMPKAAFEAKAVDIQLPLKDIAEGIARTMGLKSIEDSQGS